MDQKTGKSSEDSNKQQWYVMKHLDMERFKNWLEVKNMERLDKGQAMIEPFYPYDFLKGYKYADMSAHHDFHDMVFLKATGEDVKGLVDDIWNKAFRIRLHYFFDTMTGRPATVSEAVMDDFFANCVKYRGRFELCPSIGDIESKDRVKIKRGPFSGYEASVVSVRHTKGELNLDLAVELVSGIMYIKMQDVKSHEITVLDKDVTGAIRKDFIDYAQDHLLKIYGHRVNKVNDSETRQKDIRMLARLARYRTYYVENHAAKTHFTALMLICAHLRKDAAEEAVLRKETLELLDDINKKSESKAATDIRAYLWIALYISTGNPAYRNACKQYIRDCQPKSRKLREFVRLMRK